MHILSGPRIFEHYNPLHSRVSGFLSLENARKILPTPIFGVNSDQIALTQNVIVFFDRFEYSQSTISSFFSCSIFLHVDGIASHQNLLLPSCQTPT